MTSTRLRTLFVDRSTSGQGIGGATLELLAILECLDRSLFEPRVVFHCHNSAVDRVAELGVPVEVLGEARPVPAQMPRSRPAQSPGAPSKTRDGLRFARRDLRPAWTLYRWIRAQDIDLVVHNCGPEPNRPSLAAASWLGLPQVCHLRTLRKPRPWTRMLSSRVRAFVAMSSAIADFHKASGVGSGRTVVLPAFLHVDEFRATERPNQLRTELGFGENDVVVTNVGRLAGWKGQDVFLRAMMEVIRDHPRARALIVGAPVLPRWREYDRTLRNLAEELGENVVFAGWRSDIPEVLAASDVLVHSATEPEPFGRVVAEGMAAGLAVVATRGGGVPEQIDDGENGLLVPPADASALASALVALVADVELRRKLGRKAREKASRSFDARLLCRELEQIYRDAVEAGGRPG